MKALFSYILSTMAGLCLVGGIAVLSEGVNDGYFG